MPTVVDIELESAFFCSQDVTVTNAETCPRCKQPTVPFFSRFSALLPGEIKPFSIRKGVFEDEDGGAYSCGHSSAYPDSFTTLEQAKGALAAFAPLRKLSSESMYLRIAGVVAGYEAIEQSTVWLITERK